MIASCLAGQLWFWLLVLVIGTLAAPWVAWKVRGAEVRGQFARHPAGGTTPGHVTVIRPPATPSDARLALKAALDDRPGAYVLHDQDAEEAQ